MLLLLLLQLLQRSTCSQIAPPPAPRWNAIAVERMRTMREAESQQRWSTNIRDVHKLRNTVSTTC